MGYLICPPLRYSEEVGTSYKKVISSLGDDHVYRRILVSSARDTLKGLLATLKESKTSV